MPTSKAGWAEHQARHGNRHQRGYGSRWDKLRIRILTRDSYLCQPCKQRALLTVASQVDHIVPKSLGGTDDESNCQSICTNCHKAKSATEGNGKTWNPVKGCGVSGLPVDPSHHWNR